MSKRYPQFSLPRLRAMSRAKGSEWWIRWILLLPTALGAGWLMTMLTFLPLITAPQDIETPLMLFSFLFSAVLTGVALAPAWRRTVALVVAALATGVAAFMLGNDSFHYTPVSGLTWTAVPVGGFLGWFFIEGRKSFSRAIRSGKTERNGLAMTGFAVGIVGSALFALGLVSRIKDWPPAKADLPFEVANALGARTNEIASANVYDLGGFIDSESLWRVQASEAVTAMILKHLNVTNVGSAGAIPLEFWRMPPSWWIRTAPIGAEFFQSSNFPTNGRGPDGQFYVVMHDKAEGALYTWHKSNF